MYFNNVNYIYIYICVYIYMRYKLCMIIIQWTNLHDIWYSYPADCIISSSQTLPTLVVFWRTKHRSGTPPRPTPNLGGWCLDQAMDLATNTIKLDDSCLIVVFHAEIQFKKKHLSYLSCFPINKTWCFFRSPFQGPKNAIPWWPRPLRLHKVFDWGPLLCLVVCFFCVYRLLH